jgi:hypothetical protein
MGHPHAWHQVNRSSLILWDSLESPASIPQVSITAPADRFKIADTALPFTLAATATDLEDGNLTGSIVYRSSIDGLFVNTNTLHQVLNQ